MQQIASAKKSKTNVCRNLFTVIRKRGVSFPVDLDVTKVTIRVRHPKVKNMDVYWPILPMRSWLTSLLKHCPRFLFCGSDALTPTVEETFKSFWHDYRQCDHEDHPVYSSGKPLTHCIPYMLHGDEGRGARKIPFLVQSWQPVITHKGLHHTTTSS